MFFHSFDIPSQNLWHTHIYRVFQRFRLNFGNYNEMISILSLFSSFEMGSIFWGCGSVPGIQVNHFSDTNCIYCEQQQQQQRKKTDLDVKTKSIRYINRDDCADLGLLMCIAIISLKAGNTEQGKCPLMNEYLFFLIFFWPLVLWIKYFVFIKMTFSSRYSFVACNSRYA